MTNANSFNRRQMLIGSAATLTFALPMARAFGQAGGAPTVIDIATPTDSGTLDPMNSLSGLLSEISQHIWETLYIADPNWQIHPLLAADMPTISADGKQITIPLRQGVKFHDGTPLTADDVVASLNRWATMSPRGKTPGKYVETLTAVDAQTVQYTMKQPYAPLIALMSFHSGAAAIMPKHLAEATDPLKEYVGTGPYKFVEYQPDVHVRLAKYADYVSPQGEVLGYAGMRNPTIDELRFVPVPNPTTRADGVLAGQYAFADNLTPESYIRLKDQANASSAFSEPGSWILAIFNTRKGVMKDVKLRRAAQAALSVEDALTAAMGVQDLWKLEGSFFSEGSVWYDGDTPGYNQQDLDKAAQLMSEAGYAGQPVRILTNTQYDYQYKTAQVLAANLQEVGFTVDLQVMDFATMLEKREDDGAWEVFITSHSVPPDPALITIMDPNYVGWWDSPEKSAAFARFISEIDQAKRVEIWKELQHLFYQDIPTIKVGSFFNPYASSNKLKGFIGAPFPAFWNATLA